MPKLTALIMPMILCVALSSCAGNRPDIYVKGKDYDDAINNTEPKDKNTYMWITYQAAKKRLKWLNHK